ncbi:MAG: hypothetical protein HZA50_09465 [Planctomycetes bacterium]|nr:hypothetical protein [Planctomycetota bacterium]
MEYWWLSIITIPALALIFWIVYKLAAGRSAGPTGGASRAFFRKAILSAVILNFGVWGVGTVTLHGDAISGKSRNDKCYVGWKGQYTEVSKGTYIYSYIHTCVTISSFPLAIIFLAVADFKKRS